MIIFDEIQNEVWHILISLYTHQRLMDRLSMSATRHDLANQLVALNALREILVVRIARLADKRKDTRSVARMLKLGAFTASKASIELEANRFFSLAEPVLKIRHEQIAHMKPGILSNLEPQELPAEALRAAESLVKLIDAVRGMAVLYTYKVGAMEPIIDLRASLIAGKMIAI